ncbi:MAG: hypothetical protein QW356_08860 [Candidatus Hadarchaeales archaeon]
MSILNSFELVEEVKEQQPQPKPYKPDDYIRLWSTSIGSVIIVLERMKGTPALYLRIFYSGEPVFEVGPFFSKRSFDNLNIKWDEVAIELERRGGSPLVNLPPSEWVKLLEQVKAKIPDAPVMPRVEEVGTPAFVTIGILAREGDRFLHQPVEFEGVIIGRSDIKTIPVAVKRKVKVKGKNRVEEREELSRFFDLRAPEETIKLVTHTGERVDEARFFVLQLQQPMEHDKFTVYAVGCEVPKSKLVKVRGVVVSEGFRAPYRPVVLATEVEPLNEVLERLVVTPELLKEAGFRVSSYEELKQQVDRVFAPDIVGRPLAKVAYALTLFSVENLSFRSNVEDDGLIWTLFFGDTRTGKSTTARWVYDKLKLGAYTVAETGSRAGLLYTVDTDLKTIIWGAVTLADREYAVIDGFDRLPPNEWMEFREARVNRRVIVRKKEQGDAPFRVRTVFCANPKNPLSTYLHPVEALRDIRTLSGEDAGASITRIDLFIPFAVEDVPSGHIVEAATKPSDASEKLRLKLLLAWKAERAVFTPETIKRLQEIAKEIIEKYKGLKIQVVHNGYFHTVAKIAAAFASLLGRYRLTERGLEVVVTEEVVPFVEAFLQEYFTALGLEGYAAVSRTDVEDLAAEVMENETLAKALVIIYQRLRQGMTISKSALGSLLGIRDHNKQQELVDQLVNLNLAVAKRGTGILLTVEGMKVAKHLLSLSEGKSLKEKITPPQLSLEWIVCPETDYQKVNFPKQVREEKESVTVTEGEVREPSSVSEIGSKFEPSSVSEPSEVRTTQGLIPVSESKEGSSGELTTQTGSKSETFGSLIYSRLSTPDQVEGGKILPQRLPSSEKEPGSFGLCYLRMAELLKSNPDGLPEDAVVRELVGMGFSEKLIRAVISFAKQQGKVSVPREGWLLWG